MSSQLHEDAVAGHKWHPWPASTIVQYRMTQRALLVLSVRLPALAATAAAQSAPPAPKPPVTYTNPASLSDGWKTGTAEGADIDRHRLEQMTESVPLAPARQRARRPD